jgi:spoIIIJ-associated protein
VVEQANGAEVGLRLGRFEGRGAQGDEGESIAEHERRKVEKETQSMTSSSRPSVGSRDPVTVEAKSIEQALVKAAGVLGVTQDEVAYEVLREDTGKGLFSFFKNPVVEIKAWVKAKPAPQASRPAREPRERAPRPSPAAASYGDHDDDEAVSAEPKEPLSPEKVEALQEELRDFCAGIVSRIAGEPVAVDARVEEGRLVLDVQSEYIAQQITKNSKLAEAMEHILRKKPRHLRQELPFRIFVDVSGLRRKREEDLIQMAFDLSAKVHENKRPIVLNYKSSYDRKIIHMALDKDARVYTKSIGSGPNRKLMILPSRDAQGSSQTPTDGE